MASNMLPKRSNTATAIPTTSDLVDHEIAVNTADKVIYMREGASIIAVANFSSSGGGTVGFEIDGGNASTTYAGDVAFDFGSAT